MSVLKWIGIVAGGILVAYAALILVRALAFATAAVALLVADTFFGRKSSERAA